jgi:UDP-N-acetyl-D-glucosamine dehydrogenase
MLQQRGAKVDYNDPYVPRTHKQREHHLRMTSKKLTAKMLATYDCVLIATNHSSYKYDWIVKHARLVVDTRNATANVKTNRQKIVKA